MTPYELGYLIGTVLAYLVFAGVGLAMIWVFIQILVRPFVAITQRMEKRLHKQGR